MYIKRHYGLTPRTMSGLFEDMFQNGWNKWNEEATAYSAPVNIHETDKSYEMQLVAPGVKKEEFKINVEKNILTISYEHKDEHTEQKENRVLRKEYQARSFKRSFTLNDRIDANGIQAQYSEGMLHLSLPKKEEAEASVKEIAIN